jgi:asparagine synthase (glutamine-hydrolysing)
MCRIAGIVQADPFFEPNAKALVEQMCALLIHGGPDDGGIFCNDSNTVVLGNRRLSLLDLSALGHQPMQKSSKYTLTYNGEIYNYKKIKQELIAAGCTFFSGTDTEVVIEAYATWGTAAFEKFDGMFAFALYDAKKNKVFLVRDAVGIKPLYYACKNNALFFASEVKAFSPIDYLQEPMPEYPVLQLAYGFIPEPYTTLKDVLALPKGTYLTYNISTATINVTSFKFFSTTSNQINKNIAIQSTREVVSNAIEEQLLADAPVGVFLSGGLDSSIITKTASNLIGNNLHSLSIYFGEEQYSEKVFQDAIVQNLKGKHTSILLKEDEFAQNIENVVADMDMPSCDGVNTWFISKYAKQAGLKAVLSGIGADELYGGYPSFSRMSKALAWQNFLPRAITKANIYPKNYNRLRYLSLSNTSGLYLFLRGHFTIDEIAKCLNCSEAYVYNVLSTMPNVGLPNNLDAKQLAGYVEFNIYMQSQLLKDADVMSMKNSIELRVPFLNNEVIADALSLNAELRFKGAYKKQMLINAFKNDIPESIWQRPKMGFSFPMQTWLKKTAVLAKVKSSGNKYAKQLAIGFEQDKVHWSRILNLYLLHNNQ